MDNVRPHQVLVTGATGFVGRRLIRRIAETYGADNTHCLVFNQSDNELEKTGRAILAELGVKTFEANITTGQGLERVPSSPEVVFHLAADTDTSSPDHSVNDVGTANLLRAMGKLNERTHFVFSGTIGVSDHHGNPGEPVNEETKLERPFHKYGRAKLATETLLKETAQKTGMRVTVVRFCAIYGRGTRVPGLFSNVAKMARSRSVIAQLNYPGRMSFTHVDNIAEILVTLSQQPPEPGQCELYIPVGEVMTVAELIEKYFKVLDVPYRSIKLPDLFWACCRWGARFAFLCEPIFPNKIYNKIWQLSLTVGDGFYNDSRKTQNKLPQLRFKTLQESLPEMVRETV